MKWPDLKILGGNFMKHRGMGKRPKPMTGQIANLVK